MKRTIGRLVLALSVLCSSVSAQVGKPPQAVPPRRPTPSPAPGTAAASSSVWLSQTTGNVYEVTVRGGAFYADWANVPPKLAAHGARIHDELHQVGTKWIGTSRSRLPYAVSRSVKAGVAWCSFVTRIEFDSVTADRITGRAQAIRRLDPSACKLLETSWARFVWTPRR